MLYSAGLAAGHGMGTSDEDSRRRQKQRIKLKNLHVKFCIITDKMNAIKFCIMYIMYMYI